MRCVSSSLPAQPVLARSHAILGISLTGSIASFGAPCAWLTLICRAIRYSTLGCWPPRLCPGATPSPAPSTPSPFKSIISLALSRPSLSRRYVPPPILQSARPSAGYRLAILQSAGSFLDLLSLALLHQTAEPPIPEADTPGRACSVPFPIRLRANFPPCTDRSSRSNPAFIAAGSPVFPSRTRISRFERRAF